MGKLQEVKRDMRELVKIELERQLLQQFANKDALPEDLEIRGLVEELGKRISVMMQEKDEKAKESLQAIDN